MPWTWSDYAGYRDTVNATGTGINLAAPRRSQPDPPRGDGRRRVDARRHRRRARPRWPRCSTTRWPRARGACRRRSSTSTSTAVPCRPAPPTAPSSTRCSTWSARHGRGLVEFVPDLLGPDPEVALEDLARRCGARGIPHHVDRLRPRRRAPRVHAAVDRPRGRARRGGHPLLPAAVAAHRRLPAQLGLVDDVHVDARGLAPGRSPPAATTKAGAARAIRSGAPPPARSGTASEQGDVPASAASTRCASSRSSAPRTSAGSAAPSPSSSRSAAVTRPTCSPTSCSPTTAGPASSRSASRTPTSTGSRARSPNPAVLISSSDAGAHVQMLCASGDTTLLLTRHVRERGDFTLEQAVYELTGRQAEVFGFHGRGVDRARQRRRPRRVRARRAALRRRRVRATTSRATGARLRRPEGGYRATFVDGVAVQSRRRRSPARSPAGSSAPTASGCPTPS